MSVSLHSVERGVAAKGNSLGVTGVGSDFAQGYAFLPSAPPPPTVVLPTPRFVYNDRYNLFKMSRLLTRMDPGQVIYNGQDQMVALGKSTAFSTISHTFITPVPRSQMLFGI